VRQPSDGAKGELALTAVRWLTGSLFIAHLYWKFFVYPPGFAGWWQNFASNGYPWFVPYYVFSAELAGAALLIPGVWSRWVSFYALPMMVGAAHFWAVREGFFFTAGGAELPIVWAVLLLITGALGDGAHVLLRSPKLWSPAKGQSASSVTGRPARAILRREEANMFSSEAFHVSSSCRRGDARPATPPLPCAAPL